MSNQTKGFVFAAVLFASFLACWSGGVFGQTGPQLHMREMFPLNLANSEVGQERSSVWDLSGGYVPIIEDRRTWPWKTLVGVGCRENVVGCGGKIAEHVTYFQALATQGNQVEVRGPCMSACTLVVALIPKDKLCFEHGGGLHFHMVRYDDSEGKQSPSPIGMKSVYDRYPKDIQEWIDRKGGWEKIPYSDWWSLFPSDLWKMGYRRCAD
jgi:hypothetical protein